MDRPNFSRCTARQSKKLSKLGGLDASGRFKTAPSKQYPAEMCQLMADATCHYTHSLIPHCLGQAAPQEDMDDSGACMFFVPLDPFFAFVEPVIGGSADGGSAAGGSAASRERCTTMSKYLD